jgi:DNA-binding NarL/FixJ family response regulator
MRVLLVEDEPLVAIHIATILERGGHEIAARAGTADEVIRLLNVVSCDVAVVDANLAGSSSAPVATALSTRRIPFVVVSGYPQRDLILPLKDAPFVPKPVESSDLLSAIEGLTTPVA